MTVPPIKVLAHEYVGHRRAAGLIASSSARVQLSQLDTFADVHGPGPVKVDRAVVAAWLERIGKLAAGSRRSNSSTVRLFLRWAAEEGHVPASAAALVPKVRQPRSVPRALSTAQVARLLRHVADDDRMSLICGLMVWLGLRCGEVSAMRVEDIDEGARTVLVHGKGGHERVLPIPAELDPHLERWLAGRTRLPGRLFPTDERHSGRMRLDGLSPRTISNIVSLAMAEAGVKIAGRDGKSAHSLRHTAASDVLDRGASITSVMALLGHAHLSSTAIYLRIARLDELRTAMGGRRYDNEPDPPSTRTAAVAGAGEPVDVTARVRGHLTLVKS
jgi:integrase/recombinase XerD